LDEIEAMPQAKTVVIPIHSSMEITSQEMTRRDGSSKGPPLLARASAPELSIAWTDGVIAVIDVSRTGYPIMRGLSRPVPDESKCGN